MTGRRSGALWHAEAGPPDAPLIALVHGSMDRSAGMLRLSRRLDDRFRVVRFDRRGYGRSTPHGGPFTVADNVTDLLTILAERPALVVGHSYGGHVAMAAAARRPDLVRGVAIYETPLPWLPDWPRPAHGDGASAAAESFMRRMIGSERWEALPEQTRRRRRAEGTTMLTELDDVRRAPPWGPDEIAVPVIAARGSKGFSPHGDAMASLAAALAHGQLVELDGARHDGPHRHPAEFAEQVVGTLARAVGGAWAAAAGAPGDVSGWR